ncbi:MAG: hypothetical protein V4629_03990 [Pseudomonadota bacterium]
MKRKLILSLIISTLLLNSLIAAENNKSDCVSPEGSLTINTKRVKTQTVLQIVADIANKEFISKTDKSPIVEAHYFCVPWQNLLNDFVKNNKLDVEVSDTSIIYKN